MARAGEVSTRTRVAYLVVVAVAVGALLSYVSRPDWQLIDITSGVTVDSNLLDVTLVGGVCDSGPRVREVEGDRGVVVVRAEQNVRGDCDSVGIAETLTLELDEPLGSRRLRLEDARAGARCRVEGATTNPCP